MAALSYIVVKVGDAIIIIIIIIIIMYDHLYSAVNTSVLRGCFQKRHKRIQWR